MSSRLCVSSGEWTCLSGCGSLVGSRSNLTPLPASTSDTCLEYVLAVHALCGGPAFPHTKSTLYKRPSALSSPPPSPVPNVFRILQKKNDTLQCNLAPVLMTT